MGILGKIGATIAAIGAVIGITRRKKNQEQNNEYRYSGRTKSEYEFCSLVKSVFGNEYQIVDNVHPSNIDPRYVEGRPYTMSFMQGGRIVLTILFVGHNMDRNKYFRNAKRACADNGITCLTFYSHFENADDYVINRIRQHLNNY